nr:Unknown Function [uncultured bacterium]
MVGLGPLGYVAYVGVPEGHPRAGLSFDQLNSDSTCPRPDGRDWTWAGAGDDKFRAAGYWWYGWHYTYGWDLHPEHFGGGKAVSLNRVVRNAALMALRFAIWASNGPVRTPPPALRPRP